MWQDKIRASLSQILGEPKASSMTYKKEIHLGFRLHNYKKRAFHRNMFNLISLILPPNIKYPIAWSQICVFIAS